MHIDHVALWVVDLNGAKSFFEHYFGAVSGELYQNPRTGLEAYFLSFSDGARLELMRKPGLTPYADHGFEAGFAHLSFDVGGKNTLDAMTRQLLEDGFEMVSGPHITGDGYYESCVLGPEHMLVELTVGKLQN